MAAYNFSTLNAFDFEELVCDLLNAEEAKKKSGVKYSGFPKGRDMGVDLLYSTPSNVFHTIVQIKHYDQSTFSQLLNALFKKGHLSDFEKIKRLNPSNFKLATSLNLTLKNKLELKEKFKPYIKDVSDVIDRTNLNSLLRDHKEIVKTHYKLFFSDTVVLERIIHNGIIGRSEFTSKQLSTKIKKYVKTVAFIEAREILKEKMFILITGEPGVGKTSLAEMLLYELIGDDYELSYIIENVKEAENMMRNDDSKQVFYFDDFLGHTALEIENASLREASLLNFINRIKYAKNKALILTTRTPIYNDAVFKSERFRRSNLEYGKYRVHLTHFSLKEKLNLVRNHILLSLMSEDHKTILWQDDVQNYIATHPNFFPRLVEFVTDETKLVDIHSGDYYKFVKKIFGAPSEIWLHAFEQQISNSDRIFLSTLFSFGDVVKKEHIEKAFAFRIRNTYNNSDVHSFSFHLKKLLDGFVTLINDKQGNTFVSFINPSLIDFLKMYFQNDSERCNPIIENCLFIEQIITRFRDKSKFNESNLFIIIQATIEFLAHVTNLKNSLHSTLRLTEESEAHYIKLYRSIIQLMFYKKEAVIKNVLKTFKQINFNALGYCNSLHLLDLVNAFRNDSNLQEYFRINISSISKVIINNINELETLSKFKSTMYPCHEPRHYFFINAA